jgi:cytochrome c2
MKIKTAAGLIVAGLLMAGSQLAMASGRGSDVAAVDNQKYAKECGSCHMAYQPGFLPERSWRKLMESLHDHFGENAEVVDADRQELTDYLVKNAAERSNSKRTAQFLHSIPKAETPLRISKVPYFVKEHREVANKVKGNDKVKSLSQCEVCHQKANDGSYAEGEINVPGIGRWED